MSMKKGFVLLCMGILLSFAAAGESLIASEPIAYHIDGAPEKNIEIAFVLAIIMIQSSKKNNPEVPSGMGKRIIRKERVR